MSEDTKRTKQIMASVAHSIKKFRLQNKLTISALAEKSGFTKSYLSQIENLKREPSIGTIVSIARALGVDAFDILNGGVQEDYDDTFVLVKANQRKLVQFLDSKSDNKFEAINFLKRDRLMDGYIITTGFDFQEEPRAHEGQELLYILEGQQEFIYNGQAYLLNKGDCCCFDANIPHHGRSLGKKKSKALIIFSMQSIKD